jgi:phenylacetate-CoA ligase
MYDYVRVAYYLASLLRHSHWSKEKLATYRNRRVREIVNYAYRHVPFYHEKFVQSKIRPEEVKTVADLNKLPIVGRKELQENSHKLISDEFDPYKLIRVSTSGSTGRPLFTHITESEDAFRKAKLLRANIICGQKPRDKWVVLTAPQHKAATHRLQNLLGFYVPIPASVFDDTTTQMAKIEKIKPDVLDGYSSSLILLAREVEKNALVTLKPRIVIGGAELIEESERRYVERIFDAPFYDEYACVELERLAWQCEERTEYHIDADSVVLQFVDEESEETSPGETGEIVCTSLFNYAMPFVRYGPGDMGKASENTECLCGRSFPLMKVVEGRKDSLVSLPDGRVLSPLVFGWAMEFYAFYSNIDQYRIVQMRGDLLRFLIKVKESNRVSEKAMTNELVVHMRKMLNLNEGEIAFQVEFVDTIPLDETGKLRKVISEIRSSHQ